MAEIRDKQVLGFNISIKFKYGTETCMKSANINMIGLYAWMDANMTIIKATDTTIDNLRLFVYL